MVDKYINFWLRIWNEVIDYIMDFSNLLYIYSDIGEVIRVLIVYSILAPFFSFIIVYLFGSNLGFRGSAIFIIFNTGVSLLIVSSFILLEYWGFMGVSVGCLTSFDLLSSTFKVPVFSFMTWFAFDNLTVLWGFLFDPIAIFMIWIILFITLIVQIYCLDYMAEDPFVSRFYAYLSIFSFFMLFMVSSPNYLQLFLGWEGVGLVSFMLISFWNTRRAAVLSGMKAMFLNRIGDIFFLFAIFVVLKEFHSLDFVFLHNIVLDSLSSYCDHASLWYFSVALLVASMAKSAQLGLHMWLPDAMEGPTPVSALIHAATMVTAGIFVLIRSSFILVCAPGVMSFMCLVGGLTALFGSTVACVQYDIKKVIAFSTCSQLGYMMLGCGSGNFLGAFFHLINHAFFKAMLFLGSGSVIHALNNEQDIRKMGGLINFLPFTFSIMFLGSMSISGVPFFSGFYSKDDVLEGAYLSNSVFSFIGFSLGLISVFFTAFYSFRLLYYVFFSYYKGSRYTVHFIHEPGLFMTFSLLFLVVPSLVFGYFFKDLFVSEICSGLWSVSVVQFTFDHYLLPDFVGKIPIIFNFFGIFSSYLLHVVFNNHISFFIEESKFVRFTYVYLTRKWFFDDFLSFITLKAFLVAHVRFWLYFERGFLYYFGPKGISNIFAYCYRVFVVLVTGIHFLYIKLSVMSVVLFSFWLAFYPTIFFPVEYVIFFFFVQVCIAVYLVGRFATNNSLAKKVNS